MSSITYQVIGHHPRSFSASECHSRQQPGTRALRKRRRHPVYATARLQVAHGHVSLDRNKETWTWSDGLAYFVPWNPDRLSVVIKLYNSFSIWLIFSWFRRLLKCTLYWFNVSFLEITLALFNHRPQLSSVQTPDRGMKNALFFVPSLVSPSALYGIDGRGWKRKY